MLGSIYGDSGAGIRDLHFHDLRHEAISRLFEVGLNVPEVALISGHKTPAQLFRYTQMQVRTVQQKLAARKTEKPSQPLRFVQS
ncbi:MAG: tyrosine-type recombinase/integrase [Alphaproteobacteria bacterium]|jgi:integrase|nr:tyrosine-type recombinase/integrase [Alphaproteobacteria bacterium]|tara:strand:- start:83 stop:334 length:252 start_codon:yes stop_codon:yes gene_type:complete